MKAQLLDATGEQVSEIELSEVPELNEIITHDDGNMYEVVEIKATDAGDVAVLELLEVEEDWGE